LPGRVLHHLGLPFTRAFALVVPVGQTTLIVPVEIDNPDGNPISKIRQ
jgi:hypothetical protein